MYYKLCNTDNTSQGSWHSQSIKTDQMPDQKFRQVFTGSPAAARDSKKKQHVPLLSCSLRLGGKLVPYMGQRGSLSGLPTLQVVSCEACMHSTLLCSRLFKSGSVGFFYLFVSFVQNLHQLHMHAAIFNPCSFFVFCCSRRDVSRCKHCSTAEKGFRFQSVSALEQIL